MKTTTLTRSLVLTLALGTVAISSPAAAATGAGAAAGGWVERLVAPGLEFLADSWRSLTWLFAADTDGSDAGHGIDPNGLTGTGAGTDGSDEGHGIDPNG